MAVGGKVVALWFAAWRMAAPRWRVPGARISVKAPVSDAPMRALLGWQADWKTAAIAAVLKHRRGAFIDVGANVGQSLLDFAAAPVRSTYVGFEPNPTCVQQLREIVSANGLDGCRIVPAGLSDAGGVKTLYLFGGDADPGASTLRSLRPQVRARALTVSVHRFDDLDDVLDEPEVALVKIDVEGTELAVLRGMEQMLREKKPWIICEVLHRDQFAQAAPYRQRIGELMRLLDETGYEVHRVVQDSAGTGVADLVKTGAFPDKVWDDAASARECDYLFVPAGEGGAARQALLA